MDPNATLKRIGELAEGGDHHMAGLSCLDLYQWVQKGGFKPDWDADDFATAYYLLWVQTKAMSY